MLAAATKAPQTIDIVRPLFHSLLLLWPLWAILVVVGAGRLAFDVLRLRRLTSAGIFDIDRMSGSEFEERLAVLYRTLGYRAEVVGSARGDFGADLIIAKDGKRSIVQAKCWRSKNVGVKAVQEAVAACGYYKADSAVVVTNSHFTEQARTLARANGVTLWDRQMLVKVLRDTQKRPQAVQDIEVAEPTDSPVAIPVVPRRPVAGGV